MQVVDVNLVFRGMPSKLISRSANHPNTRHRQTPYQQALRKMQCAVQLCRLSDGDFSLSKDTVTQLSVVREVPLGRARLVPSQGLGV